LTITAGEVTAGNGVATAALSVAPITQPDLPRNITVKGNAGGMAGNVVINGHDKAGYAITETIALSGSSEVVGSKAFARVTEIVLPARTAEANTVSIGLGVKLGLSRPIEATTDVKYATVDGTANAVSASDAGNGTITMTTAPNGSRVYIVYYDAVVL
jgi:hypothetical protein